MKLYGMGSPNVQKIIIALEELEIPFDFEFVDVWMGEQFSAAFTALNPNHKVPVLIDDTAGGDDMVLWESGAILQYLADKTGRLIPEDATGRYQVNQWLFFQMASLGPMLGQKFHFSIYAPEEEHAYSRSRYGKEVDRLFSVMESRLSGESHLGGADYSIADIAAWPWVNLDIARNRSGEEMASAWPSFARWHATIAERPAVARAMTMSAALKRYDPKTYRTENPEAFARYIRR